MADEKPVVPNDSMAQRDALRDRFEESRKPKEEAPPEPKEEEPKKEEPKPDLKKEDAPAAPAVKGAPALKEPIKLVPHEALHEEREKHKETKAKVSELQKQLDTVLADVKKLMDEKKEPAKAGDDEFDLATKADLKAKEEEIAKLTQKLNEIEPLVKKRAEQDEAQVLAARREEFEKDVSSVHDALEGEGFPGFREFKTLVGEEITRLVKEDEANKHLDTPAGWAKVYKETVYPKLAGVISAKKKAEKVQEKVNLKKDGNLVKSPGSPLPDEGKKEDDWNYARYMEERKKVSAMG